MQSKEWKKEIAKQIWTIGKQLQDEKIRITQMDELIKQIESKLNSKKVCLLVRDPRHKK